MQKESSGKKAERNEEKVEKESQQEWTKTTEESVKQQLVDK